MYTAIIIVLLAIAFLIFFNGIKSKSAVKIIAGILFGILSLLFFGFMDFWGEYLWFEAVGYPQRFWTLISVRSASLLGGFILGALVVQLLTFSLKENRRIPKKIAVATGGLISCVWGYINWEIILKFWYGVSTGVEDPLLNIDTGFYLFTLPFITNLHFLFLILIVLSLILVVFAQFFQVYDNKHILFRMPGGDVHAKRLSLFNLYLIIGLLFIFLGLGKWIDRYHLLYSDWGVVAGAGWTDANIRMPALTIVSIITVAIGFLILIPKVREKFEGLFNRVGVKMERNHPFYAGYMLLFVLLIWFIALTAIPAGFQYLLVSPNEITYERPYIENNIKFTRIGFGLHNVIEEEFPVSETFTRETVAEYPAIFSNIRLWDWRALDDVYKQFQEIRLYYEFDDVDIDRYIINDTMRQVMVSAREMKQSNLPQQSRTFVNQRFKYTHGFGITLTNVNQFTPNGLPELLIRDIPPVTTVPELQVDQPRIYYGELTDEHVIVNTEEAEFDYPQGEGNAYNTYDGKGGVQLSNIWRRFLFGYKFDGTRLFFSSYPNDESRIMFHRQIHERIKNIAPFLQFDEDPYIVLAEGKLYWIIDAYTTSSSYPYSEPFSATERIEFIEGEVKKTMTRTVDPHFKGINYIRNSVKVVVDAYHGSVDYYIFEEDDPLIRVWDRIFPGLFKTKDQMPEALMDHIRYPVDMLLIQGLVYAKYHMTDPTVFYNQEDLWIRATEKYYDDVQPVEPYYVIWELPGSDEPQFVLMMPFTPKNRQVMIGWIAGMSDPENYGKFLAYKFPKDKRVLGPQQVETKIDQDRFLSGQLTLWDQRGSNVIRGNVLAIPVGNTLIYVEPIYLQAQTAAYPELRLVVVMHNDKLSYAETFDEALAGIFGEGSRTMDGATAIPLQEDEAEAEIAEPEQPVRMSGSQQQLIQRANDAYNNYVRYTGEQRFKEAAEALEQLRRTLEQLAEGNAVVDSVR